MAERKISYLAKNYDDYRNEIIKITQNYYGDLFDSFNDASIGSWLVDIFADVADTLSYNIDRAYQETSIESANERETVLNMARTLGCKVPGKKAAVVEVELFCDIPLNRQGALSDGDLSEPDESYAPYLRRGMLFSTGLQTFELMQDVDFSQQFDVNGVSDRRMLPKRDANGNIIGYSYAKLAIASAGQSKIYKRIITDSDIKPFMEIVIDDADVLNIESIIVKEGSGLNETPNIEEFYVDSEEFKDQNGNRTQRFFEVDSLIDQYRFGSELGDKDKYGIYNPKWEEDGRVEYDDGTHSPIRYVQKGKWYRLKNKFITEYTNNGKMKVIFGKGLRNEYGEIPEDTREFTQYMMSRMQANDYMGVLPESGKVMFILYRVGGGNETNIAKGTLKHILYKNVSIPGNCTDKDNSLKKRQVSDSISVINTAPSYGGKDAPSIDELKYLIKYNNSSQNRCVTLHDYYARIMEIHPKYGCPFRIGIIEENNKIIVYCLGIDYLGRLRTRLAEQVAENIKNYLSRYRMVNDFIEIRSGRIINLSFDVSIFIEKTYDKSEVTKRVIDLVYDYMDIRKHQMGEDIFLGDLEKEISKLDGVQNLISLRVFNNYGEGYSEDQIAQSLVSYDDCGNLLSEYNPDDSIDEVDLKASDKVLFTDANSMFEIKYKSADIKVIAKQRD